jgi:hypothetical protein
MVALDLRAAPEQREESAVVVEAADLWLLFALLAMRDGRFNEALERYTELRRQTPVLPRPDQAGALTDCFVDLDEYPVCRPCSSSPEKPEAGGD